LRAKIRRLHRRANLSPPKLGLNWYCHCLGFAHRLLRREPLGKALMRFSVVIRHSARSCASARDERATTEALHRHGRRAPRHLSTFSPTTGGSPTCGAFWRPFRRLTSEAANFRGELSRGWSGRRSCRSRSCHHAARRGTALGDARVALDAVCEMSAALQRASRRIRTRSPLEAPS
jgi:hypothetical protein